MQFQIIMFAFSLIGTAIALPVAPVDALNSEDFAVSDFDSSVETNLGRSVPVDALNDKDFAVSDFDSSVETNLSRAV